MTDCGLCWRFDAIRPIWKNDILMGEGSDRFHVGMGVAGEAALRKEAQSLGLPWPLV